MNVSPATLVTGDCIGLLRRLPLNRILLELSEHDPVEDYDVVRAVLGQFEQDAGGAGGAAARCSPR